MARASILLTGSCFANLPDDLAAERRDDGVAKGGDRSCQETRHRRRRDLFRPWRNLRRSALAQVRNQPDQSRSNRFRFRFLGSDTTLSDIPLACSVKGASVETDGR